MKERLIIFLAYLQIGQDKFEKNVGLSRGFVNKVGDSIRENSLQKITDVYSELNTNWLKTGEGEMLKTDSDSISENENRSNPTSVKGSIRYWVDVDATAGGVQLFGDTITKNYIDLQIPEFRDCTDAVNLYGDSMLPLYKSGQIIILKEWTESFIDFGNVYLVITKEGNRMVKYLRKADVVEKVLCVSENKDFDPFPIDRADILRLYIVKGAISKNVL